DVDHAMISLVDEMSRAVGPPRNPVFAESGIPERIGYYYLWHFAAAATGMLTGASGWEADAALTLFTGFAFLTAAAGLAVWLSGRMLAGFLALALAVPGSARLPLEWMDQHTTMAWIRWASGLGGWLFQTSWAPQHVASATWVVLACVLLQRLTQEDGWVAPITLALVAAAAFQSSVWVGGIVFTLAALA